MELRQLVYFEAIVRFGGFSRAAQQLRIAQPAVSAQIRRLETELGTPLLERTTRRVTLTHAGELFLMRARAVLDQLDRARAELDQLASVMRGHLRIGATPGLAALDLPRLLAGFNRRYPGVALALRTGLIGQLLGDLEAGDLDVVLGPIHDDLPPGFIAERLVAEEIVLITPPGRPSPGGGPVSLDQLRDEPFVCLAAGSGLHTILLAAAGEAGFEPRVQFETYSPASIRELVAAGLGVALLSTSNARAEGPVVQVHELVRPPRHPPIGMIRGRTRAPKPVTRAWRAHLRQALATAETR
ncbi:LysR family transcriptional regulator [Planosporangium thailandense]|uniref:LysR family transcriptional regulator n=1 Tax=Planosporangium thailandense TaxID=765197 RepID=A0ABX0Y9M2_9ACTN|nr:LysR family transcriptional regulator [Planosporangium thailandense]NJC74082.1 LysR family transcriptional regulator [Planosporangium thailandense]